MNPWRKLRPPTGPISPAQNAPAVGSGPRSWSTTPASWSGTPKNRRPRPLHVNSSAAERVDAGQHLAQVLVGGRGVAHVELHGLADGDVVAHHDGAGRLVAAEHVAHEEVAASEVGLVLVDHDAEVQAGAHERAVLLRRRGRAVLHALDRRRPGELLDAVALAAGHHVGLPDRSASLRHDRAHREPLEEHPDRAGGGDALVEHEAVAAGPARRRRRAADHLQPVAVVGEVVVAPGGGSRRAGS